MTIATIISITGQAWARDASGDLRELRVGDTLQEGETLVTSDNGRVLLDFADGLDPTVIGEGQEVAISADLDAEQPVAVEEASVQDEDLEALLTALEEGEGDLLEGLDATAAGAGGAGGPGGGHDFVRLARISENVDPLSFEYSLNTLEGASEVEGLASAEQALDDAPSVNVGNPGLSTDEVTVTEGDQALFTVSVTDAAAGSSLALALSDGTADIGDDYAAAFDYSLDGGNTWTTYSGPVTLVGGGNQQVLVRTQTLDDSVDEPNETYLLTAALSDGTSAVSDTGTATIVDNDEPGVSVDPAVDAQGEVVDEGDQALFTVSVTDAAAGSSLALALSDGTADVGDDYAAAFDYSLDGGNTWTTYSGPVTLVGEGNQQVLVRTQTLDDSVDEPNETYLLTAELSDGTSAVSDTGTATIVDNDEPGVSVDPAVDAQGEVVDEGDQALFTVSVTDAAAGSSLALALSDGTADVGDDYAAAFDYSLDGGDTWTTYSDPVTLVGGGNQQVLVRTQTLDDSVDEPNETYLLTAELSDGTSTVSDTGTASIVDNDEPGVSVDPAVDAQGEVVDEGDQALFTVSVTDAAAGSSLALALSDGTADVGDDYAAAFDYSLDGGNTWTTYSGPVTLVAGGNQQVLVRTQTLDDSVDEPNETYQLTAALSDGTSTVSDTGTATIVDNDEPGVSVDPAVDAQGEVVDEGDQALFTVSVTDAAAGSSLTLSLADGTALDADYFASGDGGFFEYSLDGGSTWQAITGPIALAAGDTTLQVRTDTIDDSIDESAETFSLNAALTSNGQTVSDAATATIADNDEPAVEVGNADLSTGDLTVTEGDTAVFGVQVTGAAAGSSLTLSLADGTALDADYFASGDGGFFEYSLDGGSTWQAITGPIALEAGDTTLQVRTDTIDDSIDESAETFSLNAALTSNGQTVSDAATATIADNDEPAVEVGNADLSTGDLTVTEGDTAVFGVQVTGAAAGSSLTLSLADGTALDADYFASGDGGFFEYSLDGGSTWQAISGPIALAAGDTTLQVRTDTINDRLDEGDETFYLNAAITSDGVDYTDAATATITDAFTAPSISIDDVTVTEGDTATLTVTLSAATGQPVTVNFTTNDGTATVSGGDYDAASGTLTFAAGQTSTTVQVVTNSDLLQEGSEGLVVDLSNPSSNATIADSQGVLTITDNAPPVANDDWLKVPEDNDLTITSDSILRNDTDPESDPFQTVMITALPAEGELLFEGNVVSPNDVITVADLDAGKLIYRPSPEHTTNDARFQYTVSDGQSISNPALVAIEVTPVPDKPDVTDPSGIRLSVSAQQVSDQISAVVGDQAGDNNIEGSSGVTYVDDENANLDFGPLFANQTIDVTFNVTIRGSWNFDGRGDYYDDFWEVLVNGTPEARFFYNQNVFDDPGSPPSSPTGDAAGSFNVLSGGNNYSYGSPQNGENDSFTFTHQTPTISVTLDQHGSATVEFAGSTTQKSETATINSVTTSLNVYTYTIPVKASLVDVDGSETLGIQLAGVPTNDQFSSISIGSGLSLTETTSGTYEVQGISGLSVDANVTLVLQVPGDTSPDFTLTVKAIAKEADGTTAENEVLINIPESLAPVALDLNGGGVDYLSRENGVVFEDEVSGETMTTAWVAPEDGLLVVDANRSGTVDEVREYVFTRWSTSAKTDIEAIRDVFDSNGNELLDRGDEAWSQFAVWQDADSDGVTDEGELVSLGEFGVESVALNYNDNSEPRSEADGDVIVHGQSSVTWTDGDVTLAEDASFAIEIADLLPEASDELDAYFQASFDGTDTVVQVSKEGAFTGGASDAEHVDQTITFEGMDMIGDLSAGAAIQAMIDNGQLDIE